MTTGGRWATLLTLAALLAGCHAQTSVLSPAPTATPPPSSSSTTPVPSTPVPTVSMPVGIPPNPAAVAVRRLTAITRRLPAGAVSVAAENLATGTTFHWGEKRGMWTGSTYKLLVLEALLLRCRRDHVWLSYDEIDDITDMIERSKNKAGYAMYLDLGGSTALAAAAEQLGLTRTRIGIADPALTTMNARDGVTLLRDLVEPGPLGARSRHFVLGLMRDVESDQRWGVGVVADPGTTFANKNGWMQVGNNNGPGEDDNHRWLVNSLGVVRVHGQRLLLAVFTQHNPDVYTGIRLVQRLARVVAPAVASAT